ncbi:MAG: type I 3-dehydroquinate dehydratase [Clostridia bacterium]|nr:type I 3-dehydroquinate dehydratase [Clostridia bacterium]
MRKFLDNYRPMLVSMVTETEIDSAIACVANSIYGGADALGFGLGFIKREYRTEENFKRLFEACAGKPVYLYSYPEVESIDFTHEECAEYLLFVAECASKHGAVICDIMCDMFGCVEGGFSDDPITIEKQMALADKIHALNCEVLYSVHHPSFLGESEIIRQAKEQVNRGADVIKIVTQANTREELISNLDIITRIKQEIDTPLLYLSSGKYSYTIRQIGVALGVDICLCVEHYNSLTNKAQPSLASSRAIRDNLIIIR